MKVRIIKEANGVSGSWVNHHIGEVFEVRIEREFFVIVDGCFKGYSMYDYCCKIVEKNWIPTNGEMIEVSDDNTQWCNRQFIGMDNYRFVCVGDADGYANWKYARKIQEPKETCMTIRQLEEKLNIENLKIIKE